MRAEQHEVAVSVRAEKITILAPSAFLLSNKRTGEKNTAGAVHTVQNKHKQIASISHQLVYN
jgi:hypothetical protein